MPGFGARRFGADRFAGGEGCLAISGIVQASGMPGPTVYNQLDGTLSPVAGNGASVWLQFFDVEDVFLGPYPIADEHPGSNEPITFPTGYSITNVTAQIAVLFDSSVPDSVDTDFSVLIELFVDDVLIDNVTDTQAGPTTQLYSLGAGLVSVPVATGTETGPRIRVTNTSADPMTYISLGDDATEFGGYIRVAWQFSDCGGGETRRRRGGQPQFLYELLWLLFNVFPAYAFLNALN